MDLLRRARRRRSARSGRGGARPARRRPPRPRAGAPRPRARSGRARPPRPPATAGVDVEQEGDVGPQAAGDPAVQLLDALDPKPAGAALVGDGRVDVAVADHGPPRLSAGRITRSTRSARAAPNSSVSAIGDSSVSLLHQLADPLRGRRSAGLAHQHGLVAERLRQHPGLRRLAGAVDSLEGDEHSGECRRRRSRCLPAPCAGVPAFFGFFAGSASLLLAGRFGLRGRGLLRGPRGLALGAGGAHLLHRGALLVQAQVPGPAAAEHLHPRGLAADRAGLLEPDQVAALREAVGLVAVRVALAADEALARLLRADDPQAVGLALLVLAPGLAALAGTGPGSGPGPCPPR